MTSLFYLIHINFVNNFIFLQPSSTAS
ncbi:unnamed protein product [Spirodela intermedia]|uniref:Uncharacterized protein n=1 Tax=Spirodela intermedia TaxID=51605 RepID=A0A7I8KG63_SPIIN|nr:unnamed protein product [Spirodela intermedia]